MNLRTKINISLIFVSILFYISCIHAISLHEASFNKNIVSGKVTLDTIPGFKFTAPWVLASVIDTRPMKVCVDCECKNITCKLIGLNKKEYKDFLKREGWSYYWFRNRFSFNSGNKYESRGIENVFRGYAFDEQKYNFLIYYNQM